ncbi:hypothetical protein FRC09_016045 [Ceratobasidium sp. 395]|nr:hypothetical protein FRC09_016045 [Ceratobasidium sp. 395]
MPDSSGLSNENVNEIPVSLGLSLPRLRFVHLSRFNMDYVFQNAGDNTLSNLSSLELGCIDQKLSLSGLGPLLERNPNLRVLCLNLGNDPRPFENMQWYTKTVSLLSLESLSLKNSPSLPWVQGFLTKLNAPNVKMLCLTVHRNDVGSWSTILNCPANGQQNSPMFPQLRRLSTNFRSEQLGPLLCAYPDLQRLDLLLNHDLTCLVILGRAPWLVPRLTQLWATQTNDRFALEMIQNRLEGGVSVPNIQSGPMGYSEYFA